MFLHNFLFYICKLYVIVLRKGSEIVLVASCAVFNLELFFSRLLANHDVESNVFLYLIHSRGE